MRGGRLGALRVLPLLLVAGGCTTLGAPVELELSLVNAGPGVVHCRYRVPIGGLDPAPMLDGEHAGRPLELQPARPTFVGTVQVLDLAPGESHRRRVDLAHRFRLSQPGRSRFAAAFQVEHLSGWEETLSTAFTLEIADG